MKRLIITLFTIGFSINGMAQIVIHNDTSCDFLKNLKFKNGLDTIIVKAAYDGSFRSPDYTILKNLDKEKKLQYNEFGIDTGEIESSSSISFIPENCVKTYNGTLSRKIYDPTYNSTIKFNLETLKRGALFYLTCVVFDYKRYGYVDGGRFFVIINVTIEKPQGFK